MKYSIGYNQDPQMLNLLDKYRKHVEALYFPIPRRLLSTSRNISQGDGYEGDIPKIIAKCKNLGIKSQLVMNSTCDGSSGLEATFFREMTEYLQSLVDLGLHSIIVVNPVYISEIKKRLPSLEIESSVNCYVKTVEHAQHLKLLGIAVLHVDNDINRDIRRIKKIRAATGLRIKVLLNEACLSNCPFEKMHWNFVSHQGSVSRAPMVSGIFIERWGLRFFSRDPARIFKAQFIPPDGVRYYKDFVDCFKIAGRDVSTDLVEFRLASYIAERFTGNLVALLDCVCLHPFFKYIDYRALDEAGFFSKMLECKGDCRDCDYCGRLAERSIVTNSFFLPLEHPERIRESKKAVRIYRRLLKSSVQTDRVYRELSRNYLIAGNYRQCVEAAEKAMENGCRDGSLFLTLGLYFQKTGQYERAIRELEKAERSGVEPELVRSSLSICRKKDGKREKTQ